MRMMMVIMMNMMMRDLSLLMKPGDYRENGKQDTKVRTKLVDPKSFSY